MGYDPTGQWTFSLNLGFFIGIGGGYSFNVGISVDDEGMIAFQYTYSAPNDEKTRNTVIGATASAGVSIQYTNLNGVSDLNGPFKSAGVNTSIAGYDVIKHKYTNETLGGQINVGPSIGGDFHVNETYTFTIGDPFRSPIKILKDWLGI